MVLRLNTGNMASTWLGVQNDSIVGPINTDLIANRFFTSLVQQSLTDLTAQGWRLIKSPFCDWLFSFEKLALDQQGYFSMTGQLDFLDFDIVGLLNNHFMHTKGATLPQVVYEYLK